MRYVSGISPFYFILRLIIFYFTYSAPILGDWEVYSCPVIPLTASQNTATRGQARVVAVILLDFVYQETASTALFGPSQETNDLSYNSDFYRTFFVTQGLRTSQI